MYKNTCLIILMLLTVAASAADRLFPVNSIPAALLKNANAVKRMDNWQFTIKNTHSTVMKQQYAITVLNEKGDEHASLEVYYSKLNKINEIKGALYNANGDLIRKLKNKEIQDLSAASDANLAEDSRVKRHDFYYKSYPYTVVYEIEIEGNQTFMFPSWVPQAGENFSVENSEYTLVYPENYQVRYEAFNYKGKPLEEKQNGSTKMKWEVHGLPAIKLPFATASWADLATVVYFAPSDFEIAGYKGNMNSWKGFGEFQYALNKGRDELPENIAAEVKRLTATAKTEKEKIRVLYNYLQKNTRYISVQLGIGGWQPFNAAYVAKNGYGDCKALTNYMHSLLKSAGIKSYYTVVYAGASGYAKNRFVPNLPAQQFNHVVLSVPTGADTMWLECTSQESPAGYMGNFTGNRRAVMITEDGGKVVATPRYGHNENQQLRTIHAMLQSDGNMEMKINTRYECLQQDRLSSMLRVLSPEKVKQELEESLSLSTYRVNQFNHIQHPDARPAVDEQLDITALNYATITGKRIFLLPNLLNRGGSSITFDSSRKSDFVFDFAYRDVDSVLIEIPEGYMLETSVKDTLIKTPFAKYEVKANKQGNKIVYTRTIEQYAGRFPYTMQQQVIAFYQAVYDSDRSRIVLVK